MGSGAVRIGPTPEVVKGVPNQDVDCLINYGSFFSFSFVFLVYVVFLVMQLIAWKDSSPK